eukprot:TRINITY_DN1763_c0_g1_i2.p1 TRINITY_DN1763_c0_g1~~TRINITY_DN1763_c0_g1_i2.p1  ORF type:complete len:178 (+),score=41.41 TRINITY_DN1763_c0_g1_i2:62-595(+)
MDVQEVASILKGARNGAVVGAAVRLPLSLMGAKAQNLHGQAMLQYVARQVFNGAKGVGLFVFVYKLTRYLLRVVRQGYYPKGRKADGLNAFLAGGAASLVTLQFDPSTTAEILLYLLKLIIEAGAKHAVEAKVVPASARLFALLNFLALGAFFLYYETHNQFIKASLAGATKRLLAD